MLGFIGIAVMFLSAFLIAVADALIKKTSVSGSFFSAVFNPWMVLILALYFIQILLALYIFLNKGELAVYGNVFMVFYAILMVLFGVVFFGEQLSTLQILGIVLGLTGALLLNN